MALLQGWKFAEFQIHIYSWLSLSRTRKGPENIEIERVRDRERKIGYSLHKGTETLFRDRERFEIEGVRDRESQLYIKSCIINNDKNNNSNNSNNDNNDNKIR